MTVQAGDIAPDFEQDTLNGSIRFHEWMGRSWCLLFSHGPDSGADLGAAARFKPEFARRGVKIVGLGIDMPGSDSVGASDSLNFPVIADADRSVSTLYGMAVPAAGAPAPRCRVCLIDPDRRVRLLWIYPATIALDFDDMLRAVDSLQRAAAPALCS